MSPVRFVLAWGFIIWAALFNLPIGLWAIATGHYDVGGIFLAFVTYGLIVLAKRTIAYQRLAKRIARPHI